MSAAGNLGVVFDFTRSVSNNVNDICKSSHMCIRDIWHYFLMFSSVSMSPSLL